MTAAFLATMLRMLTVSKQFQDPECCSKDLRASDVTGKRTTSRASSKLWPWQRLKYVPGRAPLGFFVVNGPSA
jgi:hypothetical protein